MKYKCMSRACRSIGIVLLTVSAASTQNIVVDAAKSHVANTFSPLQALGACLDRLRADTDRLLTDPLLKEVLSAGWGAITYRQNTELHGEAWHWNDKGTWSNPEKQEGYFVGTAELGEPIHHSWAYPLPHRGFSRGDGNGWSRLTDGDLNSYWKSNPYLTRDFTGEPDSLHPQWVVIDLGEKKDVNAIRIAWTDPYARQYAVQLWTGEQQPFYGGTTKGTWQTFPMGTVNDAKGGTATLKLISWTIPVRFLRIWMTESSNTCSTHGSADKRNCRGYAIRELYVGTISPDGRFTDLATHHPSRQQTVTWPSSMDPWHAATDLDKTKGDQVGFDFFFNCGVTRGLPTMVPIAMLYSTPEDAANEIAYLYKRRYPISWIEMGEEADGQHMLPEDYGALYLQFASAIHKLVPEAKLGGPAFEPSLTDIEVWPDAAGNTSWLRRFLNYLKAHGRMSDFTFFSFEHYPFMNRRSNDSWDTLYQEPTLVDRHIQIWKDNGLPPNIPFFMTEGNLDFGGGVRFSDLKSGLWLGDYIGAMMTGGASGTFFFHYTPSPNRSGYLLSIDQDYRVRAYLAQYFATQLITREWVQPIDSPHRLYRVSSDVRDASGNLLVTAYAVERPDGQWSVMLINKDHDNDHAVRIAFTDPETRHNRFFSDKVNRIVFGANEYEWHPDGVNGRADPDGPPSVSTVKGGLEALYQLPKASIIVLRGTLVNQ